MLIHWLLVVLFCLSPLADAEEVGIQFLGEVQGVDATNHIVTVKHAEIPGYAARGISEFTIGNEVALSSLHSGDDIRATVHPNDRTLYNIRVVYRRRGR